MFFQSQACGNDTFIMKNQTGSVVVAGGTRLASHSGGGWAYNTGSRRRNEWRRTGGGDITKELFRY